MNEKRHQGNAMKNLILSGATLVVALGLLLAFPAIASWLPDRLFR